MPGAEQSNEPNVLPVTPGYQIPDDTGRFTTLYREHHSLVRDFACRRVGADLAQEIVAETFLVAWRRLDDIPVVAMQWLYRVALYEIANLRRRQAKASRLHLALLESRPGAGTENDPEEITDLSHAIAIAFVTLKPSDYEILRLAAWEQLSNIEGAAVLPCSVSAYRMRLHRARIRLATKSGAREHLRSQLHDVREPAAALSRTISLGHRPIKGTELVI